MKKLLGVFLIVVFVFSIYFSISGNVVSSSNDLHGYATNVPIPAPESPEKLGL